MEIVFLSVLATLALFHLIENSRIDFGQKFQGILGEAIARSLVAIACLPEN